MPLVVEERYDQKREAHDHEDDQLVDARQLADIVEQYFGAGQAHQENTGISEVFLMAEHAWQNDSAGIQDPEYRSD